MKHPYDGGPAFPRPESERKRLGQYAQTGMSLRDWFAGQALAGQALASLSPAASGTPEIEAKIAYQIADAMLRERADTP